MKQAEIAALVAAVTKALGSVNTRKPARKMGKSTRSLRQAAPLQGKEERKLAFEVATVNAFANAGFADVLPNKDVLTYGRWEAAGYRVRKGEKAIRVSTRRRGLGVPMFHKSQVEAIAVPIPV